MKKLKFLSGCLFLVHLLFAQQNNIFINEFLASNVSVDADIVDFDDYTDWIELYNDESFDVDIGGYFLSDDPDNPVKWQIPPGTIIEAKGFLRFWADGYNDQPGKTYTRPWINYCDLRNRIIYFETNYYHLNFKLIQQRSCYFTQQPVLRFILQSRFSPPAHKP